jgi:hypothetical protein
MHIMLPSSGSEDLSEAGICSGLLCRFQGWQMRWMYEPVCLWQYVSGRCINAAPPKWPGSHGLFVVQHVGQPTQCTQLRSLHLLAITYSEVLATDDRRAFLVQDIFDVCDANSNQRGNDLCRDVRRKAHAVPVVHEPFDKACQVRSSKGHQFIRACFVDAHASMLGSTQLAHPQQASCHSV